MKKPGYRTLIVILVFGFAFMAVSCPNTEPPPDPMPPITQIGANTFGCDINGIIYKPQGQASSTKNSLQFYYDAKPDGTVGIFGDDNSNSNKFAKTIWIQIEKCFKPGKYILGKKGTRSYASLWKTNSILECTTNPIDSSWITVSKLDTSNKIISGTFDMTIRDSASRVIRITRGRFDMKYPYPK